MLDFIADVLGPLSILGAIAGALVGLQLAGWKGLLGGIVFGFVLGIWVDNTKNPTVVYLRRYIYGLLILAGLVSALRHWLAGH